MPKPSPEQVLAHFRDDVKNHVMTVLRDDGIDRHLMFKAPGHRSDWFEVLTWDGRLYIGGDHGTYVFERQRDMLSFFRHGSKEVKDIDPTYWAEKCKAVDKGDGIDEFSWDEFKADVQRYLDMMLEDGEDNELAATIREEVEDALTFVEPDEYGAATFIREYHDTANDFRFTDWECDSRVFSHYYLWNCYAIAWAIQVYDAHKAAQAEHTHTTGTAGPVTHHAV